MSQPCDEREILIGSIFSDETGSFRVPAEPDPGDAVSVRLRIKRGADVSVTLLKGFPAEHIRMWKYRSDDMFDWYEAKLYCREDPVLYSFLIRWNDQYIHFNQTGACLVDAAPSADPEGSFRLIPGFHVPAWAKGALQYQILPDRFRDGNPASDVRDREYFYAGDYVRHAASWNEAPAEGDYRCMYGGDLPGVLEKLDYLQSLGVEAIYFNPIFVSPSSHKYDTQDYAHVDPHLTVIARDGGRVLPEGARDNAEASMYIRRTTDPANLEASDAWFAEFCEAVHRRGMRLILDGVFNHCGSFGPWMDREGIYRGGNGMRSGAWRDEKSPFRSYFTFGDDGEYECWWNVDTLPKLCYERSDELCERIFSIAQKWASPPYAIDGWRLDVGADLGHTRAFNHLFWKEFRRRVKAVNPDTLIIAEHYGDPGEWLKGDEWDTVMNYDAFMEPLTFFLTGMEKHSDSRREDLFQNGPAFFETMLRNRSRLPSPSAQCAMNELSNHDHSRFLTRTNGRIGRVATEGSAAASEGVSYGVFREAVVVQMTWPGAPTIYYGDEAGLAGWTDPDNRRAYPWGGEDAGLIDMHRELARLRAAFPALRNGSLKPLAAGRGTIAYARFDGEGAVVVACNNNAEAVDFELPLRDVGARDGAPVVRRFLTGEEGFDSSDAPMSAVKDGALRFRLGGRGAAVMSLEYSSAEG